jgi:hypothetical protein
MNVNSQSNKRTLLIIVSVIDALLSGTILLIYFGLLPINISSSWGIQPWAVGLCGGVWFTISIGILVYQLTKTEI